MNKEEHWAFHIRRIFEALKKYPNTELSRYNLTSVQVVALMVLYDSPNGEMTMKEMEKNLEIAQSTTVGLVSRLEKKKYVETFTDAHDKRIKHVKITAEGMEYCKKSEHYMYEGERLLLSALSEEEQVLFQQYLKKISSQINE